MARARLRELGFGIGRMPTGRHNAITDVDGVLVGHATLIHDEPRIARTGCHDSRSPRGCDMERQRLLRLLLRSTATAR